jgi:hypothetical protein
VAPANLADPTRPTGTTPWRGRRGSTGGSAFLIVSSVSTPAPGSDERWISEARQSFLKGAAFAELGRAAARGAVMACRIREEGAVTADHVVAICPRPEPWR